LGLGDATFESVYIERLRSKLDQQTVDQHYR
jgi:hypothetical protein